MGDAFGVVVEYVQGLPMFAHVMFGSFTLSEAGEAMAGLFRRLHAIPFSAGADVKAEFSGCVRTLTPLIASDTAERLSSLIDSVPDSDALLHMDVHLGNVVVSDGVPTLIDLESAGFGHPVFDLAVTRSHLLLDADRWSPTREGDLALAERIGHAIWDSILTAYFPEATEDELMALDERIELLAHLCHLSARYVDGHIEDDAWRNSAEPEFRKLAALASRITRLDF